MNKIPTHWIFTKLGEVCTKPQYGWTSTSALVGDFSYVRITDIKDGIINWKTVPFAKDIPNDVNNFLIEKDDILIARSGSVGQSVLVSNVPNKAFFASYLIRFKPIIVNPKYIRFFLKSEMFTDSITENVSGNAIPNINATKLSNIEIPLPPLSEQNAIAEKLDILFSHLETSRKKLAKIPKYIAKFRQAVLQRAVSGELTAEWREDNKIDYLATKLAIGEFIEDIQSGKSFRCLERTPNTDEIGVLKLSAISWSNYLENESKTCIDETKINSSLFVKAGDFLMSRANTKELVGACVIVKNTQKKVMLSDKILRITFNLHILPYYVLIFLRSAEGREQIERYAKGTQESMKNITQIDIRNIRLNIPHIDEQHEIVHQVELLFAIADKAQKQYETAMEYFQKLEKSVLLQAFSGELVEAQAQTESLEDLLERIKMEREKLEKEKKVLRKEQAKFKQNIKNMEKKSIEEMLKEAPLSVEEIWQASVYFENKEVEKFYEELCKLYDDKKIDKDFLDDKKITTIVTLKEYAN